MIFFACRRDVEPERLGYAGKRPIILSFRIEEIKHVSDKLARIESLQPLVKNGTIQFSRKHYTLLEQMKFFPRGVHDDALDSLSMAVNLAIKSRKRLLTTIYDSGRVETIYNE